MSSTAQPTSVGCCDVSGEAPGKPKPQALEVGHLTGVAFAVPLPLRGALSGIQGEWALGIRELEQRGQKEGSFSGGTQRLGHTLVLELSHQALVAVKGVATLLSRFLIFTFRNKG